MRHRKLFLWLFALLVLTAIAGSGGGKTVCDLLGQNKDVPFQTSCYCYLDTGGVYTPLSVTVAFFRETYDATSGAVVSGTGVSQSVPTDAQGVATYPFTVHLERSTTDDHDFIQGVRVAGSFDLGEKTYLDTLRRVPLFWLDPTDTVKTELRIYVRPTAAP